MASHTDLPAPDDFAAAPAAQSALDSSLVSDVASAITPETAPSVAVIEDEAAAPVRDVPAELITREVARRRTFGIISHPDAGKTTLTEKLLLFSGAIQLAGTVKARKSGRHATSDWMEIE